MTKKVKFGGKPQPRPETPATNADAWVQASGGRGEPIKRLTVDMPAGLHRRVKSQCALENLNMAEVVRELLEDRFGKP